MFSRTKAIHLKRIPTANEGKSSCWQLTSKSPCSFNILLIPNPAGPAKCNLGGLTASPKGCQDKAALVFNFSFTFLIWHFLLKRYRYQTSYYVHFQRKKRETWANLLVLMLPTGPFSSSWRMESWFPVKLMQHMWVRTPFGGNETLTSDQT